MVSFFSFACFSSSAVTEEGPRRLAQRKSGSDGQKWAARLHPARRLSPPCLGALCVCDGCEVQITALNNAIYDIERFGIHFVASPRHADMLLVTGPVTRNMEVALKQTYDATPEPRLVVAVGACAISGGIFGRSYASCGGVDTAVPVDVYIPGCPPRPEALLHGILLALGRETNASENRS